MKASPPWLVAILVWSFTQIARVFCFFGRHNFKAVDIEWDWVIMECSCCPKTSTQRLLEKR